MPYTLVTDDQFPRADTSFGSGTNSTNVGNGWIDFAGNIWQIHSNLVRTDPALGPSEPVLYCLYRQASENTVDGKVLAYNYVANPACIARFTPDNGGSGYAALLYAGAYIFFYKAVNGVEDVLSVIAITVGDVLELVVSTVDLATTRLTANIYNSSDLSTVVSSVSITDTTPALQGVSGALGVGAYSSANIVRVQTYSFAPGGPIIPGTLVIPTVGAVSKTKARISWGFGADGFPPITSQLHRGTTPGFVAGPGTALAGATTSPFRDTGLTPGTTYYYRVVYTDDSAQTAESNEVSITTVAAGGFMIGFVGDSNTAGLGASGAYRDAADQEVLALRDAGYSVDAVNGGLSGTQTSDWLATYTVPALTDFQDGEVNMVSIMLGTNDSGLNNPPRSAADYQSNLQGIIDLFIAGGIHRFYLQYPPFLNAAPGGGASQADADAALVSYQGAIDALVNNTTVFQGDTTLYDYTAANTVHMGDGVHLDNFLHAYAGNAWAAEVIGVRGSASIVAQGSIAVTGYAVSRGRSHLTAQGAVTVAGYPIRGGRAAMAASAAFLAQAHAVAQAQVIIAAQCGFTVTGYTVVVLTPVQFEALTDLSIGGITRRQQHLYVHTCNLWRVDTPIGNNGKPGDSTPVLVYTGIRCFYEFTPNIDDPAIIARINRPNLFTTDVIHFLSDQEVRDQWWAVNTTRDEDGSENQNYGQVHRILADPKNTPGTRHRRTNKQSVPATREQKPLAMLIEGL